MAKENEIFSSCVTCFYYVPGLGFPESRVMSFPIASALPGPDSRSVENGSEVTEVVVDGSKLFRAPASAYSIVRIVTSLPQKRLSAGTFDGINKPRTTPSTSDQQCLSEINNDNYGPWRGTGANA